jgi:protein-S-isoprenylcysteine O-methyltransferase Ste14
MEPTEVHEFSEQMKEAGEESMLHVSLIISVLAVLVAMVTVMGHRTHTESVLMQNRANDQWNAYQTRKIRVQNLEVASDNLALFADTQNGAAITKKVTEYRASIAKWNGELQAGEEKARELENETDVAEKRAARFDMSEAILQISVVLASITLLTKHPRYVIVALVLGLVGMALGGSAFTIH